MNKKSYSFCSAKQFFDYSLAGRRCGLLSAKGGLMMGARAREPFLLYRKNRNCKEKIYNF